MASVATEENQDIFTEKIIPMTVHAWTFDPNEFKSANGSTYRIPKNVREAFDRLGYDVRIRTGRNNDKKFVISWKTADDPWFAPTQRLRAGDTLIIDQHNNMSVIEKDA